MFSAITIFIHRKSDDYNDKWQTWEKNQEKETVITEPATSLFLRLEKRSLIFFQARGL